MSDTRQLHSLGGGGLLARVLARGHGGNMSAPQGECESAPCLIAGAGGGFGAISMRCSGKGGSLRYVANNGSSWLELSVGSSARAQSSNDLNTSSGPEHPPSIGGAPIGQRWGRAVGSPYSGFRGAPRSHTLAGRCTNNGAAVRVSAPAALALIRRCVPLLDGWGHLFLAASLRGRGLFCCYFSVIRARKLRRVLVLVVRVEVKNI
jgi:hypothetical protein